MYYRRKSTKRHGRMAQSSILLHRCFLRRKDADPERGGSEAAMAPIRTEESNDLCNLSRACPTIPSASTSLFDMGIDAAVSTGARLLMFLTLSLLCLQLALLSDGKILLALPAAAGGALHGWMHSSFGLTSPTLIVAGISLLLFATIQEPAPLEEPGEGGGGFDVGRGGGPDAGEPTGGRGALWNNRLWRAELASTGVQLAEIASPAVPLGFNGTKPDGNCLYRCFAHLELGNQHRHQELRDRIAEIFRLHQDKADSDLRKAADAHRGKDEPFLDYVDRLQRGEGNLEWGGPIEIIAYSAGLQRRMEVYRPGISDRVHHLLYSYGDNTLPTVRLLYTATSARCHFDVLTEVDEPSFSPPVERTKDRARRQTRQLRSKRGTRWGGVTEEKDPTSARPQAAATVAAEAQSAIRQHRSLNINNADEFPALRTVKLLSSTALPTPRGLNATLRARGEKDTEGRPLIPPQAVFTEAHESPPLIPPTTAPVEAPGNEADIEPREAADTPTEEPIHKALIKQPPPRRWFLH